MENDVQPLFSLGDLAADDKRLKECVSDSLVILEPWYLLEKSCVSHLISEGEFSSSFTGPSTVLLFKLGTKLLHAQTCTL